jgi:hypothetical protein
MSRRTGWGFGASPQADGRPRGGWVPADFFSEQIPKLKPDRSTRNRPAAHAHFSQGIAIQKRRLDGELRYRGDAPCHQGRQFALGGARTGPRIESIGAVGERADYHVERL